MIEILEAILKGLANRINGLGFVSKAGGLLAETTIVGTAQTIIRTAAQIAPFADGKLVDVSPDKGDTVNTFFTAGSTRVTRQDVYLMQMENEVTLTGWVNGNRVSRSELASPEFAILSALQKSVVELTEGSPIRSVEIEFIGDNEGQSISRWGWDKPEFQYGASPHRIFQQRYRVSYTVSRGCADQSVHVLNPSC